MLDQSTFSTLIYNVICQQFSVSLLVPFPVQGWPIDPYYMNQRHKICIEIFILETCNCRYQENCLYRYSTVINFLHQVLAVYLNKTMIAGNVGKKHPLYFITMFLLMNRKPHFWLSPSLYFHNLLFCTSSLHCNSNRVFFASASLFTISSYQILQNMKLCDI